MIIPLSEFDECAAQLVENYIQLANRLKLLSADYLAEMQLKATIKNDTELMIITELANN